MLFDGFPCLQNKAIIQTENNFYVFMHGISLNNLDLKSFKYVHTSNIEVKCESSELNIRGLRIETPSHISGPKNWVSRYNHADKFSK